jgi:drug/metabolite transporter (DMT)-like permease
MSDGLAFLVMLLTPLAFSSNAVFGRAAVQSVEPFTLGFLRWSAVALILLPFCWRQLRDHWPSLKANWRLVLLMGFLGQWICGAIFYLALTFTTAANGILIYSSVPAIIIVIERLFLGRALIPRQVTGIFIAMFGIGYIMVRGSLEELLAFRFNPGDAIVLITSLSWALYSIFLRKPVFQNMGNAAVLNIVSCAGALLLAPVAVFEMVWLGSFPTSGEAWSSIAGIVFVASLIAFLGYQFGVRRLGAAVASIFMYLLPIYGVLLAWLFLNETIHLFHLVGTVLVLGGVALASLKRRAVRPTV